MSVVEVVLESVCSAGDADDAPVAEAALEDQNERLALDLGDGVVAAEALLHAGGDSSRKLVRAAITGQTHRRARARRIAECPAGGTRG